MELKDVMLTDAEMKACYPDRPICNQNVFSCDECSGNCKAIAQAQLAKLQPYIEKARREERERVINDLRKMLTPEAPFESDLDIYTSIITGDRLILDDQLETLKQKYLT